MNFVYTQTKPNSIVRKPRKLIVSWQETGSFKVGKSEFPAMKV